MGKLLRCFCLLVIAAVIAGCGAHSSFTVDTDGSGSLRGLRTDPADGEDSVGIDVHICVYWVEGYEPPTEFTFRLRDEDDESVLTTKKSANDPNQWIFEPWEDLDYDTVYTIEVSSGDSTKTFIFLTEEEYRSGGSANVPAETVRDPGGSEPQVEHRVTTGR